jgi:hypothetical protein
MNVVTGRRGVPEHGDRSSGAATGNDRGRATGGATHGEAGSTRGGAVAPHPRPVPRVHPVQPRPHPAESGPPDGPVVELEPTTGAPVDAVPRRVPVRQPIHWHRRGRSAERGRGADDGPLIWAPIEEVHWDGTPLREEPRRDRLARRTTAARRPVRRASRPPDPLRGLAALLALSLLAAFFAWVSAGPFWLAAGHASPGTVVIARCTGDGLTQRCRGIFVARNERFFAHGIRVSGVPAAARATGTRLPARMTGPTGGTAYADTGVGQHLRWVLGLLLVLACAAGIARFTGSTRLPDPRHRRWAVTTALAGPSLITLGFLAAAW